MKNKERGITLIALAITIIVLLVLAGISISSLLSDNGILKQSKRATEQHKIEEYKQELTLILLEAQLQTMETKLPTDEGYADSLRTNIMAKIDAETYNKEEKTGNFLCTAITKTEGYKFTITATEVIYGNGVAMNFTTEGDKNSDGKVDVWDEVAFGDEEFIVIKKEGTTLTLLAKYNLATTKDATTGKWKQLTGAGGNCAFSSTNYWSWTRGIKTDLNTESLKSTENETNNAIARARAYAGYFGASGRLLSWGEVTLGQTDYLFTNNTSVLSNGNFWLGTSYVGYNDGVYGVNSDSVNYYSFGNAGNCGIRPVLTLSNFLSE